MSVPSDLGAADAGFLLFIPDFAHLVRWDGAAWQWAPGDEGNGFIRDFVVVPPTTGWQLCDGSPTSLLVVGRATLVAQTLTAPNESSGTYHKASATTDGAVQAAVAATISGSTATESAHTHNVTVPAEDTTDESAHTHDIDPPSTTSGANSTSETVDQTLAGATVAVAADAHTHDTDVALFASGTGSAHHHTAPAQTVASAAGSAHSHGVGSLVTNTAAEPAHILVVRYLRR